MAYDVKATEAYIRQAAVKRGINPDIAVRVARSEGLANGVYQSNLAKNGVREPSFGPFQLLVGGKGTSYPAGMGNDFIQQTGLDPRDPSTVPQQVDFALDNVLTRGWSPWYGAAKVGVGKRDGIGPNAAPAGVSQPAVSKPAPGSFRAAQEMSPPAFVESVASSTSTAPIPTTGEAPMASNYGGLGGLGGAPAAPEQGGVRGFLRSDGFGDMLSAVGLSLLSSPNNAPFAGMAQALPGIQTRRERSDERALEREQQRQQQLALGSLLQMNGYTPEQAQAFSTSTGIAQTAMSARTAQEDRDREEAQRTADAAYNRNLYGGGTVDPAATGPVSATPVAATGTAPASAPTAPATAAAPVHRTTQVLDSLYSENDRLYQAAATAQTDSQRRAAETAIRGNEAKIARTEKLVADSAAKIPNLEVFYDDETGREYKGYLDPSTGQPVRVGGLKAAPQGDAGVTVLPDGTVQVGGQVGDRRILAGQFGLDPNSPEGRSYILTGNLPSSDKGVTAADRVAIREADDAVMTGDATLGLLDRATELSGKAYEGFGAPTRALIASQWDDEGALATREFDNIITEQALGQLKAIFGGAPTEGERAILLDIQGSSSQPKAVRDEILKRAKAAVQRRTSFNRDRATELRGGTYYDPRKPPEGAQPAGPVTGGPATATVTPPVTAGGAATRSEEVFEFNEAERRSYESAKRNIEANPARRESIIQQMKAAGFKTDGL